MMQVKKGVERAALKDGLPHSTKRRIVYTSVSRSASKGARPSPDLGDRHIGSTENNLVALPFEPIIARMSQTSTSLSSPELIVRLHGTAAARVEDAGTAWWQCGSPVEAELTKHVSGAVECEKSAFHWSGANTESDRELAATALFAHIAELEREGRVYHLVGHSHGGAVIWKALTRFCAQGQSLPGLKSWTTVGSPYLHYRPVPFVPIEILPLLVFAALALPLWARFGAKSLVTTLTEAYTYRAEIIFHGQRAALAYITVLALIMAVLFLVSVTQLGATIYRLVRFRKTQEQNRRTFELFRERALILWSPDDEAINGLASTLAVQGDIVPRLPASQGKLWKRMLGSLVTPVRTVFNRWIAPIADSFIWQSVTARLQGSDFRGWELAMVSNSPCPEVGQWSSLGKPIVKRLLARANSFASTTIANMRAVLGLMSEGGHGQSDVLVGFKSQFTFGELIHTSYFEDPDVLNLIADHISDVKDDKFKDSCIYSSSIETTGQALPRTRMHLSLFPIFSVFLMFVFVLFIGLLERVYVAPHTEENAERTALAEGSRLAGASSHAGLLGVAWSQAGIAGIHHWLQALVLSGHLDRAMVFAQHSPSESQQIDSYLCIALAEAQIGNLERIEDTLDKIWSLPEPQSGTWMNITNWVLDGLIESDHPAAAKPVALQAASLSEAISDPERQGDEMALLARSFAKLGEKDDAIKYATKARDWLIASKSKAMTTWEVLAQAFYLAGDTQHGGEAANKGLALDDFPRSEMTILLFEGALSANDRKVGSTIVQRIVASLKIPGRGTLGEVNQKDVQFLGKMHASSILHGFDDKELVSLVPDGMIDQFTNQAANELARRGAIDKAIAVAKSYPLESAAHKMIASLAPALISHGYAALAISEANQTEDPDHRPMLARVALALSKEGSCSQVPGLANQTSALLEVPSHFIPDDRVDTLIELGTALARCKALPDARPKLHEALSETDEINDPTKRIQLMGDLNKGFVRERAFSDSLGLAVRAFTPQNELDIYSDILLEEAFIKTPSLERGFIPLRDRFFYMIG
jgi:tetratricopeptide (TPR) repeat protein